MALLIDQGLSQREVAEQTGMAPPTVSGHVRRVMQKLGAKSVLQAVVLFDRQRRNQWD